MSDWTSNEAKEFLSIIRGEAEKVVKDFGDRQSSIYACLAVVTDVSEAGAISVRLLSSPDDGSQDFVVPNQSGSAIEVGDSVWLHYWGDYTNAYIGIKNGDNSSPVGGDVPDYVGATISENGVHGLVPAALIAEKGYFLRGDGAWNAGVVVTDSLTSASVTNALSANQGKTLKDLIDSTVSSNLLINGGFDVWQRGTSFTTAGYTADHWYLHLTGSACTTTRQEFAVGQSDVPANPAYYVRNVVTSAANAANRCSLFQPIESVKRNANGNVTFSFYAKADAAKNIAVEFYQTFGTGGSPSADVTGIGAQKITLTTSWARYSVTAAIPSISGKTLGTTFDGYLGVVLWMDAGSNFNARTVSLGQQSGTFEFATGQLNSGSVALPFVPRSFADEFRLCQRYCIRPASTVQAGGAMIYGYGGNYIVFQISTPVTMRDNPTITGIAGTDVQIIQSSGGAVVTVFTFTGIACPGIIRVLATKTAHGLSTPSLIITGTAGGFDAEL
jgi:hypothetical protein